jgi:hypothetical protein
MKNENLPEPMTFEVFRRNGQVVVRGKKAKPEYKKLKMRRFGSSPTVYYS